MCGEVLTKDCSICRVEKALDCFYQNKENRDGLYSYCKECHLEKNNASREKNKAREIIIIPDFKACPRCKTEKSSLDFNKSNRNVDGLSDCCKECQSKAGKASGDKNKARETIIYPESKLCPGCNLGKLTLNFSKNKRHRDGLDTYCKGCMSIRHRERMYGLSDEQYQAMLKAQGGACAICKFIPGPGDRPLDVDHIHGTYIVRGLLCHKCNKAIGNFIDSVIFLGKAIEYLGNPTSGVRYSKRKNKTVRGKMLAGQNYTCKVCSMALTMQTAYLDHDHLTNIIRGCLCRGCNSGLGAFNDSVEILQNAINYLTKYSAIQQSIPADKPHLTQSNTSLPSSLPY